MESTIRISEARIQSASVVWFKNTYRELRDLFYQNKNDGHKHKATAATDTAMGLTAGIPDTYLAVPRGGWHGLYVEFKRPGQNLSDSQKKVIPQLQAQGYRVEVVTTEEQFRMLIYEYLSLPHGTT
ncbi:VRR-NUC domain-containing protein [Rufibacter soli]